MKKLTTFLSILFVAVSFHSCASKTTQIDTFQFNINSWEWEPSGTIGTSEYSYIATHDIPEITSDVLNNGTVLGYIGDATGWIALPYTLTYSGYSTNINYAYVLGGVGIICKDTDLFSTAPSGTLTFKMVVVTEKQMPLIHGVNTHNYYEVEDALNLK
jgi:hypothetical protein